MSELHPTRGRVLRSWLGAANNDSAQRLIFRILLWRLLPLWVTVVGLFVANAFVREMLGHRICVFHFSRDRTIVMRYSDFMAELEVGMTYEVYVGSTEVVSKYGCCGTSLPFDETTANFRAFEFPDGKVAVQHQPNDKYYNWETVVIHDFRTGQSWPRDWHLPNMTVDIAEGTAVRVEDLLH